MTMKRIMSCLNCGKLIEYKNSYNHMLCDECSKKVGEESIMLDCILCGTIDETTNMVLVGSVGSYVCKECSKYDCFTCDECGEVAFCDNAVTLPNGDTICYDCWENNDTYFFCECGEIVRYDEADENYLCEECQRYYELIE